MTVATLISYNADEQAVLFDILYDRYERKSTIIVSQKSPVMWIKEMQGTTLAESSVNRATHNNYSLTLKWDLKAVKKIQGLEGGTPDQIKWLRPIFLMLGYTNTTEYDITNSEIYPIRTSVLEGINNKIKVLKRIAYGFRDNKYFFLRIKSAFKGEVATT